MPNEHELIALETQYWQAMKDKDADAAMRLTDDGCIITGAQGVMRIDSRPCSPTRPTRCTTPPSAATSPSAF